MLCFTNYCAPVGLATKTMAWCVCSGVVDSFAGCCGWACFCVLCVSSFGLIELLFVYTIVCCLFVCLFDCLFVCLVVRICRCFVCLIVIVLTLFHLVCWPNLMLAGHCLTMCSISTLVRASSFVKSVCRVGAS